MSSLQGREAPHSSQYSSVGRVRGVSRETGSRAVGAEQAYSGLADDWRGRCDGGGGTRCLPRGKRGTGGLRGFRAFGRPQIFPADGNGSKIDGLHNMPPKLRERGPFPARYPVPYDEKDPSRAHSILCDERLL